MKVFTRGNDNSIYFHLYGEANQEMVGHPPLGLPSKLPTIRLDDLKPTGFFRNKISLHESGVIHSTDRAGKRRSNGTASVPFSQIAGAAFYLHVAPQHPASLPIDDKPNAERDVVFGLPLEQQPFLVEFGVKNAANHLPLEPLSAPHYMCPAFTWRVAARPYELIVQLSRVVHGPAVTEIRWPHASFVLQRADRTQSREPSSGSTEIDS